MYPSVPPTGKLYNYTTLSKLTLEHPTNFVQISPVLMHSSVSVSGSFYAIPSQAAWCKTTTTVYRGVHHYKAPLGYPYRVPMPNSLVTPNLFSISIILTVRQWDLRDPTARDLMRSEPFPGSSSRLLPVSLVCPFLLLRSAHGLDIPWAV